MQELKCQHTFGCWTLYSELPSPWNAIRILKPVGTKGGKGYDSFPQLVCIVVHVVEVAPCIRLQHWKFMLVSLTYAFIMIAGETT